MGWTRTCDTCSCPAHNFVLQSLHAKCGTKGTEDKRRFKPPSNIFLTVLTLLPFKIFWPQDCTVITNRSIL